jgi:hypothetical protein
MSRPARSGPTVAALLLALTLVVGGCSGGGDDESPPGADGSPASTAGPDPVATRVHLGRTTGKLSKQTRRQLTRSVAGVVDGWLDAAFVAGDYPRTDFHDAFPRFTRGARADAHRDRTLLTNQDIGNRIDGVRATHRRVWVDALVVRRQPVGVTARFVLDFVTSGDLERRIEVRGRLLLTRDDGWRVFGYDVTKGPDRGDPKKGTGGKR